MILVVLAVGGVDLCKTEFSLENTRKTRVKKSVDKPEIYSE